MGSTFPRVHSLGSLLCHHACDQPGPFLGIQLEALIPVHSRSMESRHLIWSTALQIFRQFFTREDDVP
jgi:hypothetical protein